MHISRARRALVVAALTFAMAAQSAVAAAQEGWGASPEQVSLAATTGGAIFGPSVDTDGAGNAIVVWWQPAGATGVVQAARRPVGAAGWGAARTLSVPAQARPGDRPFVAVDASGHAVVMWTTVSAGFFTVHTARYDVASDTWAAAATRSSTQATGAVALAGSPSGDAVLVWGEPTGVVAARYTSATDTWGATVPVSTDQPFFLQAAADAAGNVIATWQTGQGAPVRAVRYTAAAATWGSVADISSPVAGPGIAAPRVAMNLAGDAVITWSRAAATVEATTSAAGSAAWTVPVPLSSGGLYNEAGRAVVDQAGNVTVVWTRTESLTKTTQSARFTSATSTWSGAADLPAAGAAYGPAAIDIDGAGNVFVVWSRSVASPGIRLLAARYAATTGLWTVASELSAISQSAWNPSVAVDAAGNATAAWFQSVGGLSANFSLQWSATLGPPAITGVTAASGSVSIALAPPTASDASLAATNYEFSLDGGAAWTARSPAGTVSPLVVTGLADGVTYALRVRTVNGAGAGTPTAALPVRSGTGADPRGLRIVSRAGNVVTFAWEGPAAGLVPTGYVLEGGVSTQQILASIPTGGAATQLTLTIPSGVFYVRIVAVQGTLRLGATSFLQIAVNAGTTPAGALNLLGSASGGTLALSWTNDWAGATITGVRLHVTGAIATSLDLPPTESFVFGGVPPGTYGFSIAPLAGATPGPATPVLTLTFPGTCSGVPSPPTAFSASARGGEVLLDWLPPAGGEAVTHYLVSASGAYNGMFAITNRTFAAPVPPGSYTVSVAAVGPCGTSASTAPQTVVVP